MYMYNKHNSQYVEAETIAEATFSPDTVWTSGF